MTNVNCASGVELLMDYLEGVVSDEVRMAIDEHVAGCPRCQAFVASYVATPSIFRKATAAALPDDLAVSLREAIRKRTGSSGTE